MYRRLQFLCLVFSITKHSSLLRGGGAGEMGLLVLFSSRLDYGKLGLFLNDSVYPQFVGVQINRTVVEISLEIPQKIKNRITV